MDLNSTINILKNQAATGVKERLQNRTAADNADANKATQKADEANESQETQATEAQKDIETQGEDFDTFLTLLTAQIKHQDPLAPLDSTQFVEQLATFSGLELQAKGNNALDRIEKLLAKQVELITP